MSDISVSEEREKFTKPLDCPVDASSNGGDKEEVCDGSCTGIGEEMRQKHEAAMPLLLGTTSIEKIKF